MSSHGRRKRNARSLSESLALSRLRKELRRKMSAAKVRGVVNAAFVEARK